MNELPIRSPLREVAVLAVAGLLLVSGLGDGRTLAAQTDPVRPDVIILLTDQQRHDAFGAAGARDVRTPAMDRLAKAGVLFTRAFAATPQCSPSRAALLTARYPHRTGVMGNTAAAEGRGRSGGAPPAGMSGALDRGVPTFGHAFGAAGYDTAYFGKWHLGATPGEYGFAVHDARVDDATLARRVLSFLEKRAAERSRRPLAMVVSWLNPHDIYDVLAAPAPDATRLASVVLPPNLGDDLGAKPFPQKHYLEADQGKPFVGADAATWRRYRAFYNQLVETVDREVGTVIEGRPAGSVPPIVVFSADHGDLGGAHGLPYKGPAMYDELVRVPLVISWPGRIRPARSDALVSLVDVLPTLCDLADVPAPPGIDGISLRPALDGRTVRDIIFAEYYGKQSWRVPIRMARTDRWKYVRYVRYGEELYDLDADPGELKNLAGSATAAAIRLALSRELDGWMRRTADPFASLDATDRAGAGLR